MAENIIENIKTYHGLCSAFFGFSIDSKTMMILGFAGFINISCVVFSWQKMVLLAIFAM
jgi:hypothetical protein